jgi:hypothetical protein
MSVTALQVRREKYLATCDGAIGVRVMEQRRSFE